MKKVGKKIFGFSKCKIFMLALAVMLGTVSLASINADAKKRWDTSGMEITDTGTFIKYTDTHDEKHGITIPKSVKYISDDAFKGCFKITSVKFEAPDKIEEIGAAAFSGCTSLKSFEVPKKILVLEDNTFNGCKSLKKIKLNSDLQSIGDSCFANCKKLSDIKFPSGLEYILENAFSNCTSLGSVKFPDGLLYIGDKAFSGCTKLKMEKKSMPVCLIRLGDKAFQNCVGLKEIKFGLNMDTLKGNLKGVVNVSRLQEVGALGTDCFTGCSNLKKVVFKNAKQKRGNKLVDSKNTQGIRQFGEGIFTNCKSLREVIIEDYFIESIDDSIFDGCNGNITIKAPQWVIEKSIKDFVERVKYNNVVLKYKAL